MTSHPLLKKYTLKISLLLTLLSLTLPASASREVSFDLLHAQGSKEVQMREEKTSSPKKTDLLLASISLDPELHPDYAPVVSIDEKALAQSKSPEDKLRATSMYGILFMQFLAGGLIYLAGPTAVLVIAIAGLRYVVSRGEDGEMDAAKKTLTYAIIGLIVIILSYAIIQAILTAGATLI